MFVKDVVVQNQVGLHARPATFFIQKANEFKSSIWIEKEDRRVNAKSLLGILSLGIIIWRVISLIMVKLFKVNHLLLMSRQQLKVSLSWLTAASLRTQDKRQLNKHIIRERFMCLPVFSLRKRPKRRKRQVSLAAGGGDLPFCAEIKIGAAASRQSMFSKNAAVFAS